MATATGSASGTQALVEPLRPFVPGAVEVAVESLCLRHMQMTEKFVHRRHDVGMRIECAAGKADVGRTIAAETLHEMAVAADDADGEPAAERLSVGNKIGAHAEILLRTASGETKADEHFIEDQDDVLLGANGAQALEPVAVGLLVEMGAPRAVEQRGIARAPPRSGAAPAAD